MTPSPEEPVSPESVCPAACSLDVLAKYKGEDSTLELEILSELTQSAVESEIYFTITRSVAELRDAMQSLINKSQPSHLSFNRYLNPMLDSTNAPSTFHFFPKLPIELRHKTWNLAAKEPQIIFMEGWIALNVMDDLYLAEHSFARHWKHWKFEASHLSYIPKDPLLSCSRESRQQALSVRHGHRWLGTRLFADIAMDTVWIDHWYWKLLGPSNEYAGLLTREFRKEPWRQIKSLALDIRIWNRDVVNHDLDEAWEASTLGFLKAIGHPDIGRSLQTIIYVLHREKVFADDVAVFVEPSPSDLCSWVTQLLTFSNRSYVNDVPLTLDALAQREHAAFKRQIELQQTAYDEAVQGGFTPAEIERQRLADWSQWTVPEVKFRSIVSARSLRGLSA